MASFGGFTNSSSINGDKLNTLQYFVLLAGQHGGLWVSLAIKPATPLSALDPYRELVDIVMVMTVEPGFGGQQFMRDAALKIDAAHEVFRDRPGDRPSAREVHVDGESTTIPQISAGDRG